MLTGIKTQYTLDSSFICGQLVIGILNVFANRKLNLFFYTFDFFFFSYIFLVIHRIEELWLYCIENTAPFPCLVYVHDLKKIYTNRNNTLLHFGRIATIYKDFVNLNQLCYSSKLLEDAFTSSATRQDATWEWSVRNNVPAAICF